MIDRIDAVPEADYAEQAVPAYPGYDGEIPDSEPTPVPAEDLGWSAAEGDLIEQSIPAPLDDDYDAG